MDHQACKTKFSQKCCQLWTHTSIFLPSVGQPHQTHSPRADYGTMLKSWASATISPPASPTLSEKPLVKARIPPTHQPRRWDCFTTQGNYQHSGATGNKEKSVGHSQQSTALGDPSLAKLLNSDWNAAPHHWRLKTHEESYMYMPKHIYHHHSPLPDFVAGRHAATTCSFQGKARGFLTLPRAPMGHPLQLHTIGRRAVRSHRYTDLSQRPSYI